MLWVVLVIALLLLIFGFVGSALKVLLWLGIILLVIWLLGWLIRPGGRRWYYW
jgi:hypothetical protein